MRCLSRAVAVVLLAGVGFAAAADKDDPAKISKEEQLLIDLANEARAKEKLPALKPNAKIAKAAAGYSAFMTKNSKQARELMEKSDEKVHELDGKGHGKRLDDVSYDWSVCGENVALAYSLDQIKLVHERWMASKYHRANILNKEYEEIGIGVVKHPDKKEWYITQVFGTQQK